MKPVDNLKTGEGDFEGRRKTDTIHTKVDRVVIKKHSDQITLNEGKMETDTTSSTTFKKQPVQRNVVEDIVKKQKMHSNITLGDDTTILRTTNQMNYNTVTTRKDERVEKSTDVTDKNRIRDGTIAITTMKVTTVLENEKDHTPIKEVIRKAGKTNVREEVVHQTSGSDIVNRQNILNEQHHINEVNQNVVNKRYIVNQHDVNNTLDDRNTSSATTHRTTSNTHVSGPGPHKGPQQGPVQVVRAINQHHQTSNIISNQNDQNAVNRSTTKHTTETIDRTGSTIQTTNDQTTIDRNISGSNVVTVRVGSTGHQPVDQHYPSGGQNVLVERHVITQTSPTSRQHQKTVESIESTRNVSGSGTSKHITSQSEHTTTAQRSNQITSSNSGGDTGENILYEQRTIVTSTPKTRQQNYTSDILNVNDTSSGSKSLASKQQSDKINNQLHLRQHDSTSTNTMSSTSSTTTTRHGKSTTHNSTSNISSIIHDGQSPCPVHRSSITTTERQQRRDYVQDDGNQGQVSSNNTQQHHHRKNVLTSSTDVNNSVFHRKVNLSSNSNEALHSNSMSSTAAIQRKSISNLHDQAIYNTSSDRKSYSSLHRQGKETVTHSNSSSTTNTNQHGGSSTHTYSSSHVVSGSNVGGNNQLRQSLSSGTSTERAQNIVKKDNLSSFGGEFYGKSESKAYGSFTSGHQHHVLDRSAVARRSNQSSISFGDGPSHGSSVYRREYAVVHSGPCPAANIEKSTYTHTRDTKSHKFYKSSQQ